MDFSEPQPPFSWKGTTLDRICDYYYRRTRDDGPRPLEWIMGWFNAQGWHMRQKTW